MNASELLAVLTGLTADGCKVTLTSIAGQYYTVVVVKKNIKYQYGGTTLEAAIEKAG